MKKIKIGNKKIGKRESCFIIAEAGVNHNGDIKLAKKLIDVAKEAGVDAVKFQTFKAENVVSKNAGMAEYQKKNIRKTETQLEMIKKFELTYKDFRELKKYCDRKKIIFLSTPHSDDAIDFLESLVPTFKIGSGDLTNLPFLEKIAQKKKPIILSTGMSDLNEIEEALKTIRKISKKKISLLHCTTNYPCPIEEVNLRAMITLKEKFEKKFAPLEIGYSDHTEGITVSIAAVAMGAGILEKHFTLDKNLPGPDHRASLEPQELKEMVKAIRDAEKALGSAIKRPTVNEEKIKKIARKSIIARIDIPRGTKITKDMLVIKRPGNGIEPKYINKVINKKTKKNIKRDELILWQDITT